MSYCRMDENSDVYCYASNDGGYHIHLREGKLHGGYSDFFCKDLYTLLGYFVVFKSKGIRVPKSAIDRVKQEIEDEITMYNNLKFQKNETTDSCQD